MAIQIHTGPIYAAGGLDYNPALGAGFQNFNSDAGPSQNYQGTGVLDPRFAFLGDYLQNRNGVQPGFSDIPTAHSVEQIPAAYSSTWNNIAPAANAVSGTAMTLVSTSSVGVTLNIPIIPFSPVINGNAVTTAPIVLDFGFSFGNVTSGSTTVTVSDSTLFPVGMPLVIAGVGNSGGTVPLLTWVVSQASATTIVINDAPLATNASTPIGTGNIWTPREGFSGIYPTAHLPYLAGGPGIFLDPRQSVSRGVVINGSASATGGAFLVSGWDIYWQPMTETITAGAGAVQTYGKKAFNAIKSVTPQFSDAHTYSVGTSDVFGLHFFSNQWEYLSASWAASSMTSSAGWIAGTTPASGDVRGTIQVSAIGGGSGIGASASNGTVSSLAMSGRRLCVFQSIPVYNVLRANAQNSATLLGATQT